MAEVKCYPHTLLMLCYPHRDERAARVLDESMSRFLCVVGLIVCLTVLLILVLTRVGREVAKQDATLDWNFNPHIKTGN